MSEVRRAILSEQDTMANAALVRYDAIVRPLLTDLQHRQNRLDERVAQMNEDEILIAITPHDTNLPNRAMARHAQDIPFLIPIGSYNFNSLVISMYFEWQLWMASVRCFLVRECRQIYLGEMLIYKPKKSIAYQPL